MTLHIDIETFSDIDLKKCGVYKYAESKHFRLLLLGYAIDGGEVRVIDVAHGERIPEEIVQALSDPTVIKSAFNAQFERVCLSRYLSLPLFPEGWHCTMVHCAALGLPLSLEQAGQVLNLPEQKRKEGKQLIHWFCQPCDDESRKTPANWQLFKEYNRRDVEVETRIQQLLDRYPLPETEWHHYVNDQLINDRGVLIDTAFVYQAHEMCQQLAGKALEQTKRITGITNPHSNKQMIEWLASQGIATDSLDKAAVDTLLKSVTGEIREVLLQRQEFSKSSVKKYETMLDVACRDHRARGLLQFYGASRTGRFAGRLIQVQNLPQNHLANLAAIREQVHRGDPTDITPTVLSELIRTAFIPKAGHRFIVADYSAIEARVLSWLAGETWRTEVFRNGGDIYCASASRMFGVPVVKNGENSHLRQKGKVAELALGYGGSDGALRQMGALEADITPEELHHIVVKWRSTNPCIVKYWQRIEDAVKHTVRTGAATRVGTILFAMRQNILFAKLPSGRCLAYMKPSIDTNGQITYMGLDTSKRWGIIRSYGAKIVENLVQAIARDLLVHALNALQERGYPVVMHVHDEVVVELPGGCSSVSEICDIITELPDWAIGLPLRAEVYECEFYQKQ